MVFLSRPLGKPSPKLTLQDLTPRSRGKRIERSRFSLSCNAPPTRMNAVMTALIVDMPTFDSTSASGALDFYDPDGNAWWSSPGRAYKPSFSTPVTGFYIPIVGGETMQMRLAAIPTGAATAHML